MKLRRLLSLALALLLLAGAAPFARAEDGFAEVDARAALLVDAGTGEILYEKNARAKNYPASITKVMTALLVLEAADAGTLRLDQEITARESAFEGLASDGSTANIKAGETMTVENLLNCLLIVSANEAAQILAEAVSGNVVDFVARMNARAAALGCADTHFVNPSGLHDDDHYTSAWDVYLITREALGHEAFAEIVARKSYTVPETNVSKARELHSTNYLVSTWRAVGYYYADARGVKTGSTPEAGYCLVANAVRGGRELISVVLGAERVKREDGVTETRSFSETIRLFDHGFNDFKRMELVRADELICEVPVELSGEANYVVARPAEGLTRMVPVGLSPDELEREIALDAPSVDAPVAEGDVLGSLTVSRGGTVYGTVPLVALNGVSASWLLTKEREVRAFFAQAWVRYALFGAAALVIGIAALGVAARRSTRRYRGRRGGRYHYTGYRGRKRQR
ncbi:MAG: D-alanyl-D-alanine carboxypeptidase [Oscillospiraceae bacterium]|nr:D-alanyl-D-alanine carboxypeptidase [Oscillospiraceae bacterium]